MQHAVFACGHQGKRPAATRRQRAKPSSCLARTLRPAGLEICMTETMSHSIGSLFICTYRCLDLQMQSEVWIGEYFCHPKLHRLRRLLLQVAVSNLCKESFFKECMEAYFTASMLCKDYCITLKTYKPHSFCI